MSFFAPLSPSCQFVHDWNMNPDLDDDMLGSDDGMVFRSTPSPRIAFTPVVTRLDATGRKIPSIQFTSLENEFPLVNGNAECIAKAQDEPEDSWVVPVPPVFIDTYVPIDDELTPQRPRRSPSLVDSRSTPIGAAPMMDFPKPAAAGEHVTAATAFGHATASADNKDEPYEFKPTGEQAAEIEQLRWDNQKAVFMRYQVIEQRGPQWGHLEERDNAVFFKPGKRREAIAEERKFHEKAYRASKQAGGDVAWHHNRLKDFEQVYQHFCGEETKYKHELTLMRLEKLSPFSKFPALANRFVLARLLGKGGNGEVWEAIDYVADKRRCALKISTSRSHARREHAKHASLQHQNIVGVGDRTFTIAHNGKLYEAFTVDTVTTDLQHVLEMFGHLDELVSLKFLFQLVNALVYLHDKELAHFDIKPSNILIDRKDCVKLTDFDLARNVSDISKSSKEGTLRFLPPECFHTPVPSHECTAVRADMWMVGVVFYYMMFGCHPLYPQKMTEDELTEFFRAYDGSISRLESVSPLSQHILRRCLHPDPRCRPTAHQLLQALQ
ncbi:TPA: hypothetical protein N0F65_010778 [Lagenidium giganteum]|uniref:Protein kinase domain-containing protein n=1 Tax=Lagenidium giganteum TaxID=4803 RepID=A0AAV2YVB9_9STRA|nr:TPA: hypothetical protein N0F65_010778 [Lagenidium giganteum]